jgi:hypothetical protein
MTMLVSEEEVRAFYDENRKEYQTPAEARSLHLDEDLKRGDDVGRRFSRSFASCAEEILEGGDFEEIAKRETEKSTGELDLGWISLDRPYKSLSRQLYFRCVMTRCHR